MQVRASYTRFSLEMLEKLPEQQRRCALQKLAPDLVRGVRSALPMSWVDLSWHLQLDEALLEALGEVEYERLCARMTLEFMQRPLIAPLTGLGRRLLHHRPLSLLERVPLAWGLVFRDVGSLSVCALGDPLGTTAHAAELTLSGLPERVSSSRGFALGVVGTLRAVNEYTDVTADVSEVEPGKRFRVAWTI